MRACAYLWLIIACVWALENVHLSKLCVCVCPPMSVSGKFSSLYCIIIFTAKGGNHKTNVTLSSVSYAFLILLDTMSHFLFQTILGLLWLPLFGDKGFTWKHYVESYNVSGIKNNCQERFSYLKKKKRKPLQRHLVSLFFFLNHVVLFHFFVDWALKKYFLLSPFISYLQAHYRSKSVSNPILIFKN